MRPQEFFLALTCPSVITWTPPAEDGATLESDLSDDRGAVRRGKGPGLCPFCSCPSGGPQSAKLRGSGGWHSGHGKPAGNLCQEYDQNGHREMVSLFMDEELFSVYFIK